jgi:hypothetical protein
MTTVIEWLKAGETFLTAEQLSSVKQMLKDGIMRQRQEALARAAALDAQAKALDGDSVASDEARSHGANGANGGATKPLFPDYPTSGAAPDYSKMTVPGVIEMIVNQHPAGILGSELVKLVCEARTVERSSVYTPLTRMADAGMIRKRGNRESAVYLPKEAQGRSAN